MCHPNNKPHMAKQNINQNNKGDFIPNNKPFIIKQNDLTRYEKNMLKHLKVSY